MTCFHRDQLHNPKWLLFRTRKKKKKEYFPLKVVNLAHFLSLSMASSSKKLSSSLKKERKRKKNQNKTDPAIVPVPVNAHADILDSPKAKGILSKCEKCSLSPPPQLRSGYCRELLVWRVEVVVVGGGVLLEGKHWMLREIFFFSPSPLPSFFKVIQLSQDVSPPLLLLLLQAAPLLSLYGCLTGTC